MLIKLNDDSYLDHTLISAIRRGTEFGKHGEFFAYRFDGFCVSIGTDATEVKRIAKDVNAARSGDPVAGNCND